MGKTNKNNTNASVDGQENGPENAQNSVAVNSSQDDDSVVEPPVDVAPIVGAPPPPPPPPAKKVALATSGSEELDKASNRAQLFAELTTPRKLSDSKARKLPSSPLKESSTDGGKGKKKPIDKKAEQTNDEIIHAQLIDIIKAEAAIHALKNEDLQQYLNNLKNKKEQGVAKNKKSQSDYEALITKNNDLYKVVSEYMEPLISDSKFHVACDNLRKMLLSNKKKMELEKIKLVDALSSPKIVDLINAFRKLEREEKNKHKDGKLLFDETSQLIKDYGNDVKSDEEKIEILNCIIDNIAKINRIKNISAQLASQLTRVERNKTSINALLCSHSEFKLSLDVNTFYQDLYNKAKADDANKSASSSGIIVTKEVNLEDDKIEGYNIDLEGFIAEFNKIKRQCEVYKETSQASSSSSSSVAEDTTSLRKKLLEQQAIIDQLSQETEEQKKTIARQLALLAVSAVRTPASVAIAMPAPAPAPLVVEKPAKKLSSVDYAMYMVVAANVCIALSRDNLFSWKMLESSYGSIFTIIGTSSFASGFTLQFFEGSVLSQSIKDKNLKSIFLSGAAVCALSLSTKVIMLGVDPKIIYALNGVALVLGIAAEVYKSQKHAAPSLAI